MPVSCRPLDALLQGILAVEASADMSFVATRANAAALVSSAVLLLWRIATGNSAAIMMNPTPRMITANITSANENPRCRTLLRISLTFHQRAVVAVDQNRAAVQVEPAFFS